MQNAEKKETVTQVHEDSIDKTITILNYGDISLDYHILTDSSSSINSKNFILPDKHTFVLPGGAWYTEKLLNELKRKIKVRKIEVKNLIPSANEKIKKGVTNTFSFVADFSDEKQNQQKMWRICQYLGSTNQNEEIDEKVQKGYSTVMSGFPDPSGKILVISEYDLYVKEDKNIWPKFITDCDPSSFPLTFMRLSNPQTSKNLLLNET